jgi:hypothetical protein
MYPIPLRQECLQYGLTPFFVQRIIPMARITAALTFMAGLFLLPASTFAAEEQQEGPVSFSVDGGAAHQSEVDLKDGGGGFEVDRWFVSAGINYAWDMRNSIGFIVGGGRSKYVFNPESGFGDGDPWGKVEDFRLSATARFRISETGTALIIPTVRLNGENGADSGDSRTYGLFAAVAWRINDTLTIGPGVGVFSRLEDGTRFFPVLAIDWDISERWNLGTGSGLAATQGPGLTLSYKASPHWTVALSGRYEDLEFRLDEEGSDPGGVGRDQSFPLVVSGAFGPSPKTSLALFAGLELGGKLKLKNSLGEVVDESSYDPAAIIGATFEFRF